MSTEDHFPWGLATGNAFLGREDEIHRLKENINNRRHTLLLAPRRYGKSSLAKHVLNDTALPWVDIDLFLAINPKNVISSFIDGLNNLLAQISTTPEQWLITLKNFFNKSEQKWTFGFSGVHLELHPGKESNAAKTILEGLNAIELILTKKKQYAIFFIDEFQELKKIEGGTEIEGAIRHYAQESPHIIFIFSGSNRRLLEDMFGDRKKPLYELCDWLNLKRLPAELYKTYLNKIALKTFNKKLDDPVINEILMLSECHPKYVYALCAQIWSLCKKSKKTPDQATVQQAWNLYITDRLKQTRSNLEHLSTGQLKILILIALGSTRGITSKDAQQRLNLAGATISHAVKLLEDQDYVEKIDDGTYRVVDPMIKHVLASHYVDSI